VCVWFAVGEPHTHTHTTGRNMPP